MKKIIVSILILFLSYSLKSQTFFQTESTYIIQNTISGGLSSSIIACFNKNKHDKIAKTFINSFWKGCLGGAINYCGKDLIKVSSLNNTYAYIWPSKILNSIGTSFIYNGGNNEKLFQSFYFQLWFLNFNYNKNIGLNYKFDIITCASTGYLFCKFGDYRFNIKNSLITNTMFFDQIKICDPNNVGMSVGNCIYRRNAEVKIYTLTIKHINILNNNYITIPTFTTDSILFNKQIACHEITHTEQYSQYSVFNSLYKFNIKNNITNYIFLNINFCLIYEIANIDGYKNNYFETEANHFGNSDLNSSLKIKF